MDLFETGKTKNRPLAERMRPERLDQIVGQENILGPQGYLTKILKNEFLTSIILWGPPGTGKTTLARLIAQEINYEFHALSAVTTSTKELREFMNKAKETLNLYNKKTVIFIDEIHRYNKSQQAYLLPFIEEGSIILIGATTENPSFEVIPPLLSRCRVLTLSHLNDTEIKSLILNGLTSSQGLNLKKDSLQEEALNMLVQASHGDARCALNTLEASYHLCEDHLNPVITTEQIQEAFQNKTLTHDKSGDKHYNLISAFIKSMRGSDPDATLYYMARLLEAGEDPLFIIRRMVIFASEDIGNANPSALNIAVSTQQAFHFIGPQEGWIIMSQCATFLASSPKSNASYMAYKKAKQDALELGELEVPLHLRNAPTKLMKNLGYGSGYDYAHNNPDHITTIKHLPDEINNKRYYEPDGMGYEKKILEWLEKVREKRS